ncbi:hypothetical protein NFI96_024393 [Prochilodus magdalenae]|nr:hypothetical protein NFI96_024393 [Prochilodus magdalenae]
MYLGVCAVLLSVIVVGVLGLTLEQPKLFLTKQKGKRAYISCKVTGLQSGDYVHWYQQKDGEAPKRILYVNKDGSSTVPNPDHPEAKDFTLQLENVNDYVLRQVLYLRIQLKMMIYMHIILFSLTPVAVLGVTVEQSELSWTKLVGKRVFISCKVTGLTTTYIHWYQQKDGEAPKRILYINQDGSGLTHDSDHPQARDFKSLLEQFVVQAEETDFAVLGLTVNQPEFLFMKQKGKRAHISCKVTDMTTSYVHWYQQKDGEALKRILYVNKDDTSIVHNSDHPEAKDFTVQLEKNNVKVAVLGVTVEQSELIWTKPAGKKVYISCKVTDLTTTYIHWYQQKDGEALKRILYTRQDGSGLTHDPNHKEAKDFTVKVNQMYNTYDLRVDALKTSHSAVYYCACWESGTVTVIIHILYKNSHSIKHSAEIKGARKHKLLKV